MRKIALFLLSVLMVTCSFLAIACSNASVTVPSLLSLNRSSLTLVQNFSEKIDAIYSGKETVEWVSADESVATVDGGVVTGVSAGETVITAKAEGQNVECAVTVTAFDNKQLRLIPDDANVSLYLGERSTLNCKLYYGDIELQASEITYDFADSQAVELNGNTVTAKSIGNVSVVASTQYKGFTVNGVINVSVSSSAVSIAQPNVSIYAIEKFEGTSYETTKQLSASVKNSGGVVDNAQISWTSSDEAICTVSNGLVTGVSVGSAIVSATYKDGTEDVTDSIYVYVNPVEKVVALTDNEIDMSKPFAFDVEKLFNVEEELTVRSVNLSDGDFDQEVSYRDGNLDFNGVFFAGNKKMNVFTDKINFTVDVYLWSGLIDSANSFKCLLDATYGHYKLTQDIDLSNTEWVYSGENAVFTGTLDGNGKTISGLTVEKDGIFNILGEGATVKNLTIKNATIAAGAEGVGLLGNTISTSAGVSVDGLSAEIVNKGTASGGLFGSLQADSTLSLNNVSVFAYSDGTDQTRGAVTGTSDGVIKVENTATVYSSMDVCGANDAFNTVVELVKPEKYKEDKNELINCYNEDGYSFTFSDLKGVSSATVYSNNKKVITPFANVLTLEPSDYEYIFDGGIEVLFKQSDNSYKYYVIGTYAELHINQNNFELLKTIRKGTIILDEDINISEWRGCLVENGTVTETYDFDGVLDGNGHTMLLSKMNYMNTGLFNSLTGTVKNISVMGVNLANGSNGTFAFKQGYGDLTFENVYVSVEKFNTAGSQAALVYSNTNKDATGASYTTTVKNVYVEIATTAKTAGAIGFVSRFNNRLVMENCVFVGGSGGNDLVHDNKNTSAVEGCTYFANNAALDKAIKDGTFAFASDSEYIKTQYNAFNGVLVIKKDNIDDLKNVVKMTCTKNIVLGEDIDMTVNGVRTVWSTTIAFNGTFDGNGHYISGLKMQNASGLFKTFTGTIKNLALVDIELTDNHCAAISVYNDNNTTIENVFVQISVYNAGTRQCGLISWGAGTKTIKNTVVLFEQNTATSLCGYLTGYSSGAMTLNNVYMVGNTNIGAMPETKAGGSIVAGSTYKEKMTKEEFLAGISAATPTVTGLSDQMKAWINAYVK